MEKIDLSDIDPLNEAKYSVFRVVGTTKVRAKDAKDLDGKPGLAIPTIALKMAPLEAISEAIRSVLSTATGLPRDNFCADSYVHVSDDRFCYPVVDVVSTRPVCAELTRSVILSLLERVKRRDQNSQHLFASDSAALSEEAEAEMKTEAAQFLARYGDSPISTPAKLYVDGGAVAAEFKGMFSGKPDLSILEPVLLEFEGCADGYRARKREIFFDTKDESLVVHWEHDNQVLGNLSLAQKTDILIFKISRTIDQRGNPIDTLVSISKK